jgi:phospholipase C
MLARAFALALSLLVAACSSGSTSNPLPTVTKPTNASLPGIKHVFIIILENQSYSNTFGATMPVPYLTQTAAAAGETLMNYYGTSHFSLGNYVSLVSGQAVTTANQDDCTSFTGSGIPLTAAGSLYANVVQTGLGANGQVVGTGCVYPAAVQTVADQLKAAKYTWKGYMEDMGNDPTRELPYCGQPINGLGVADNTSSAQVPPNYNAGGTQKVTDQYAARHNPFVYFHSLLDSGQCAQYVVPLNATTLPVDLQQVATTPNFSFITPNLCDDGHDVPCKSPSSPQSQVAENNFLTKWVHIIVNSPAFQQDGLLIINFDEASPASTSALGANTSVYDATSCCNEQSGPNTTTPGYGPLAAIEAGAGLLNFTADKSGGGQTGAILISPFIKPGSVTSVGYNHYYVLRTIEDLFGLQSLGYAQTAADFGADIFGTTPTTYPISPSL